MVGPTTSEFGVNEFINLLLAVLKQYAKHQVNINEAIPDEAKDAIAVLIDLLPTLAELNPPGPE